MKVQVSSENISWKLSSLTVSVKHWITRTGSCRGRMWPCGQCYGVASLIPGLKSNWDMLFLRYAPEACFPSSKPTTDCSVPYWGTKSGMGRYWPGFYSSSDPEHAQKLSAVCPVSGWAHQLLSSVWSTFTHIQDKFNNLNNIQTINWTLWL